MRYIFLLFLFFSNSVVAESIEEMWKAKKIQKIAVKYLATKKRDYTKKEYIIISRALRKVGFYRKDITLNVRFIKKFYMKDHVKLMKDSKESNTVDPDVYHKNLKIIYWIIAKDLAFLLKQYKERNASLEKDYKRFQLFSKMIVDLEYVERKVDKLNNLVNKHLEYLTHKVYRKVKSFSYQYVSWQREVFLIGPGSETGLNVTNRGYCLGGDAGIENYLWHFYFDGCFLVGFGNVQSAANPLFEYQQSNISAYGLKGGPGASLIVSSSKSRLGIKLPIIYTVQKFQAPADPIYTIVDSDPITFMATLYSRFQSGKWYFQTEFGKYFQKEEIFWALGIGKEF